MDMTRRQYRKPRTLFLSLLCMAMVAASLIVPAGQRTAHAAGEMKPFPQQLSYPGIIKPNHVTQASMNAAVTAYYDYWKAKYLKNNLSSLPGGYYVKGEATGEEGDFEELGTSEGQGYGMVITALMAGYDPNAQTIYNGLFKTARAFKSKNNSNLMGWIVADHINAQGHYSSATDGDLDIAYSLLLADRQWGSNGSVNYLAEAKKMITNGIKASYVTTNNRLNLGDWDEKNALNTRPSDWMLSHLRAFYEFTGDQTWLNVINNLYSVYTQFSNTYSPSTGLISDFIVKNPPEPAPEDYLNEFKETNQYFWNASRVPLRIVMDYALYGDTRGKTISDKIATWIKGKTSGQPSNVKDGYKLNGTAIGSYASAVFVSPFIAAATTNTSHQAWVNAGWDWMKNKKESYYSDTFNLLTMLFITGNWWKPTPGDTTDTQPPTAPANLTATAASSSQINLTWSASTDNVGVTGYRILRGGTQVGTSTGTSYSDTGLAANTPYSYVVQAVDAAGNVSPNSNTATATTQAGTPGNGTNLALGKAGTASSIEGAGFEAAKAFDGNTATRWASLEGVDPQWIYVNLGSVQSINKVRLNWEAAYASTYKVQVSTDSGSPTNWTDVYSTTSGKAGVQEITFAARDAKYVRVYGTARGTAYGYSLYEFEVYGPGAASVDPGVPQVQIPVTLSVTQDTYSRGGAYSNDNYGAETSLGVKKRSTNQDVNREAYLKFDTSSLTGTVNSAILKVYLVNFHSNTTSQVLQVQGINSDMWDELTLTASNQPTEAGALLSSETLTAAGAYVSFDVTAFVKAQTDGVVSFRLVGGDEDTGANYASKEHTNAAFRPVLVINGG